MTEKERTAMAVETLKESNKQLKATLKNLKETKKRLKEILKEKEQQNES